MASNALSGPAQKGRVDLATLVSMFVIVYALLSLIINTLSTTANIHCIGF